MVLNSWGNVVSVQGQIVDLFAMAWILPVALDRIDIEETQYISIDIVHGLNAGIGRAQHRTCCCVRVPRHKVNKMNSLLCLMAITI